MLVEPPAFSECVAMFAAASGVLDKALCVVAVAEVAGSAADSENQSESKSSVLGALAAEMGGESVWVALFEVAAGSGAAGSVKLVR